MAYNLASFTGTPLVIPPAFENQVKTTEFILDKRRCFIMSDPGTGKTRSCLDAYETLKAQGAGKMLVLAPKAILEAAWKDDARKFTPTLKVSVAYAAKRMAAFEADADIYVTNHDAAKWLADNIKVLDGFDTIVIDESTAYKNRASLRSRAVAKIIEKFENIILMCGTPMPNGLEDIWHQMFLVDGGEILGPSFWRFRNATYTPVEQGGFVKWEEKPGARDVIADLISDRCIRYSLEECIDMPEQSFHDVEYDMSPKLMKQFQQMIRDSLFELENGDTVSAIHEAAKRTKLLQMASGAVYDGTGAYKLLDNQRYELIAQLCSERPHTLVGFMWKHQKIETIKALVAAGIKQKEIITIDGDFHGDYQMVMNEFQSGKYRVMLAHPQSAGHGLTLTKAKTIIWSAPTDRSDLFEQFNRRIYRIGQEDRTEVILVKARNSYDHRAYDNCAGKVANQEDLLTLLKSLQTGT